MCVYICIHMPIYVCAYGCMCVHVCVHRCLCLCVCTCIYREWAHMCNVYIPRNPTSHLVQKYPSRLAGCLQSGGCFCWKFCGLTPFLRGAWACPRCPAHILSQHDRLQKEQGQSDHDRKHCSLQRPSADSLRRQTSGDSKRKLPV